MRLALTALLLHALATAQVTVPFVGCASDGQAGPVEAPKGDSVEVNLTAREASQLAYYSAGELGVLGPRGWLCFSIYGSSGSALMVAPQKVDFASFNKTAGPKIVRSKTYADGSGSSTVRDMVARLFPSRRTWAEQAAKADRQTLPRPREGVTHKTEFIAEYKDGPASVEVILDRNSYDLAEVFVHLPADLGTLAPEIIAQVEREASQP